MVIGLPSTSLLMMAVWSQTGVARRSSIGHYSVNVLVLFFTFLDNLLDGLHLSLCEPTGLWEVWESNGVLDALFVNKVWNGFWTYCTPLLLTTLLGQLKSDTVFLTASLMSLLVVASWVVTLGYFEK